ncbi:hypothetical protein ACXWQT_09460, partial [Streptococcus pyogenes]
QKHFRRSSWQYGRLPIIISAADISKHGELAFFLFACAKAVRSKCYLPACPVTLFRISFFEISSFVSLKSLHQFTSEKMGEVTPRALSS